LTTGRKGEALMPTRGVDGEILKRSVPESVHQQTRERITYDFKNSIIDKK
jgi:hypothetical protein